MGAGLSGEYVCRGKQSGSNPQVWVKDMLIQDLVYRGYVVRQYHENVTSLLLKNRVEICKGDERSPLYQATHWLTEEEMMEYAEKYFREKNAVT